MTTTVTDLLCNHFGGIRRKNSRFDAEQITCTDCQNVELYDTKINQGVGIRTAKGSKLIKTFSENEEVLGIWESNQDSGKYLFVYTEGATSGSGNLYSYNPSNGNISTVKTGLTKTGNCCGTDYQNGSESSSADVFVFTNGTEMFYVDMNAGTPVTMITSNDVDGNPIRGLGLVVYNNRLWVFHDNCLYSSCENSCTDWATHSAIDDTSAFGIDFTKPVTAIAPYLGSLAVFFSDSSCLIAGTKPTDYQATDESPGGCAGYNALVFHGTDLWFYDDTKKGVFSFKQVVNGDKTLGENVAIDIQEELMSVDSNKLNKIKTLSVVVEDRNEIWFILQTHYTNETTIMIFDYLHGEWVKRVCPPISCLGIFNGSVYSGGMSKLMLEYYSETNLFEYDETTETGINKVSKYICSTCNFGINNALKIFYFPPRVSLDMANCANKFYVKYIRNYDYTKNKKEKYINAKGLKKILHYDSGERYDRGYAYLPSKYSSIAKFPSATFKTLEIQIYTKIPGEEFSIQNLECTKVKIKQI